MKVYPTKFEAMDDGDSLFRVEAFDEATAHVHIDTVVNVASWDVIAPRIRECLAAMELEGDLP